MDGLLLSDWLSLRGQNNAASIIQSAYAWLDIGAYEDLQFITDVREATGGARIVFETSPTREDTQPATSASSFRALLPKITLATGLRTDIVRASTANVPPARFVRWRMEGDSSPWSATFRVWVAAYALGGST